MITARYVFRGVYKEMALDAPYPELRIPDFRPLSLWHKPSSHDAEMLTIPILVYKRAMEPVRPGVYEYFLDHRSGF